MTEEFTFRRMDNRLRLVGTIVSPLELCLKGKQFCFYIDARIKEDEQNLIPVVCTPNFVNAYYSELTVGNRVAVFGRLNSTHYTKIGAEGKEILVFKEYMWASAIFKTEKVYPSSNVGIFKGKLVKQPQIYKCKSGHDLIRGALKLGEKNPITIGVTFHIGYERLLQDFQKGDELAIKYKIKNTTIDLQKTHVQPYWVFGKNEDLQTNKYFLDLDANPNLKFDK